MSLGVTALSDLSVPAGLLHGLHLLEYELLLFAAFWFVIGIFDELAVDLVYFWHRIFRHKRTNRLAQEVAHRPLIGRSAVFIPAWQEAGVIGATLAHALKVWQQEELRIYVGCYRNDAATLIAAMAGAGADPRVRLVVHDADGPTTKADCLNRLYQALRDDEARCGMRARSVILHDSEDMVHPAALALIDLALSDADFVQLPVRPEPQRGARWIAGHYLDEFTEAHAKAMVVRDLLGAALPAAGVGCAFTRSILDKLAGLRADAAVPGPFEADCLTEDYELGLLVTRCGGRSRFLRLRDTDGSLVATRSYFPATLDASVRQKTRWIHGIAFQGWERLGWWGKPVDIWMSLRDRRGPLVALVLAVAYFLLLLAPLLALADHYQLVGPRKESALLDVMIAICFLGLGWRAVMRFAFTKREYGWAEGLRAVVRIPIANVIAIMSGRRAFVAYLRSMTGRAPVWDKTVHHDHPALVLAERARA